METVARAVDPRGELALRRRAGESGEVLELIVDGVFAMDSAHTATEVALARTALARIGNTDDDATEPASSGCAFEVLVGGLGLGYTAAEVLADPRVNRLVVVELHPALADWAAAGLLPVAGAALADPRTELITADVVDAVAVLPPGRLDAILLDVDNGPAFLVHEQNAAVYGRVFLAAALAALRPGGVLAIWSAEPAPQLQALLAELSGGCEQELLRVTRERHTFDYAIYLARGVARDAARR